MLCDECQTITFQVHTPWTGGQTITFQVHTPWTGDESSEVTSYISKHQPDLQTLQNSASHGCHFCALLWHRLSRPPSRAISPLARSKPKPPNPESEAVQLYCETSEYGKTPEAIFAYSGHERSVAFEVLELERLLADAVGDIDPTPGLSSTGSISNLTLATTWLNRCLETHENCQNPSVPSIFPTRVLDVTCTSPKLILTKTLKLKSPATYLTLSHCWGKQRIITTTLATLAAHQERIPMSSLSQTFRDAVTITRKMGFEYLWIDSLCIIQDSTSDWESEAAKMGDYYRHSLFTISAAGAEDGSVGCFMQRDARLVRPCALTLKFQASNNGEEKVVKVHVRPRDDTSPFWKRAYSPLDRRGWVMQERLLAPRSLIFESNKLSWMCLEMQASERFPEGRKTEGILVNMGRGDEILRSVLKGVKVERGVWGSKERERLLELYDRWYDLIKQYSTLELTYESDIFPALSGIAGFVQNATGNGYVAGLWRDDLQRGLLWSVAEPGERLEVWRAPSWSWAGVKGEVMFHDFEDPNEDRSWDLDCVAVKGVDVITPAKERNPFGKVSQGMLHINGYLKLGLALKVEEVDQTLRKDEDDDDNIMDTDTVKLVGRFFPDDQESLEGGIFCLPIIFEKGVFYTEDDVIPDEAWTAICLALVPTGDYDIYRRVGLARINDSRWVENERVDLIIV